MLCLFSAPHIGMEETKKIWRSADCVTFDVDSTVCVDEGIDKIADFFGKGVEVAELTSKAMEGHLTYKDSLRERLNIISPTQQQISDFTKLHQPQLTAGISDLVAQLQLRNVHVFLISGGFSCLVHQVADRLNIPHGNVYSNDLLFHVDGSYAGFDESKQTCEDDGKAKIIRMLKDKFGYKKLVHVGDGTTDMTACPPADAFIGFGGNQVREKVKLGSSWFVTSLQELLSELQ